MLTFLGAILRVLIGFALACLAAALVQVIFAVTPAELVVAGEERIGEAGIWVLLTATEIVRFAWPFALLGVLISEWQGLRSFAYHAIVAMTIAVVGFGLIHATESAAEASIVNSYAMAAYLTSGFVGGVVYWLISGRRATRTSSDQIRMESDRDVQEAGTEPQQPAGSSLAKKLEEKAASPQQAPQTENARMAQQRSTGTVPVTRPSPRNGNEPTSQRSIPKTSGST